MALLVLSTKYWSELYFYTQSMQKIIAFITRKLQYMFILSQDSYRVLCLKFFCRVPLGPLFLSIAIHSPRYTNSGKAQIPFRFNVPLLYFIKPKRSKR